ncbi:hypothetical protein FOA43_000452 [Brettanomyces nanus]|uniref:HORMA domain-containing protein n=1 Tax=Eeniella nana TaxID=13502 RepID=A0A875RWC8_EENNA|nr:uncharacterized protein FOA43_000452 [Brettanomyces nanus]QPG73146.1 hypothetical protein FOA43_000452 [Brettanomyces nanus]
MSLLRRTPSSRLPLSVSEDLINSFLFIAVSSVSYLRGLFDDLHFVKTKYSFSKRYGREKNLSEALSVQLLKEGLSLEADTIILWLRNSVGEAIHRGYLQAVCLTIILDNKSTQNVFESYTFSVNYERRDHYLTMVINDNELVVDDEKNAMMSLLKHLIAETQLLPALPPKRYLLMRLVLNKEAPKDYVPEHFKTMKNSSDSLKNPQYSTDCGSVKTIHHEIRCELSSKICTNAASTLPNRNESDSDSELDTDVETEFPSIPYPMAQMTRHITNIGCPK